MFINVRIARNCCLKKKSKNFKKMRGKKNLMHLTCEIFILIFRQFISLFGALRVFRSHSIFTFRALMVMGYNCVTVFSPRNFRKLSWCKILSVTVDFKEAAWEVCQIFLLLNLMVLLKCNLAAGGVHKSLKLLKFQFL